MSVIPTLRRLVPYYRPYIRMLVTGLTLVVISSAIGDVPMLDDPPLGHLQAIVLKKLDELGKQAFGFKVIEELSLETGVWIDPSRRHGSGIDDGSAAAPTHRPTDGDAAGPAHRWWATSVEGDEVAVLL